MLIDRTAVSLRLGGPDLDPAVVTAALGHDPSYARHMGERWLSKRGLERVSRTGIWTRKALDTSPGDLDGQIRDVLGPLTDDLSVWQSLTAKYEADIFCGLFLKGFNEGCEISAQTLLALGQRGIALSLDVYGGDEV